MADRISDSVIEQGELVGRAKTFYTSMVQSKKSSESRDGTPSEAFDITKATNYILSYLNLKPAFAQGGFGSIHLGHHKRREEDDNGIKVVAKVASSKAIAQYGAEELEEIFEDEAEVTGQLYDPSIVTVTSYITIDQPGSERGRPCILYRYVGPTMRQFVQEHIDLGLLPPLDPVGYDFRKIGQTMTYLHKKAKITLHDGKTVQGIVHRDISSDNFFMGELVMLGDLGIAHPRHVQRNDIGKVMYWSPELLKANIKDIPFDFKMGCAADVYALMAVFREVLTGRHPFYDTQGNDLPTQVINRHEKKDFDRLKPLDEVIADAPKEVTDIVNKGMHPDWKKRMPLEDFGEELGAWLFKGKGEGINRKVRGAYADLFYFFRGAHKGELSEQEFEYGKNAWPGFFDEITSEFVYDCPLSGEGKKLELLARRAEETGESDWFTHGKKWTTRMLGREAKPTFGKALRPFSRAFGPRRYEEAVLGHCRALANRYYNHLEEQEGRSEKTEAKRREELEKIEKYDLKNKEIYGAQMTMAESAEVASSKDVQNWDELKREANAKFNRAIHSRLTKDQLYPK